MTEQLLQLDKSLFHHINMVWTSPALDALLPWLRNKYIWAPFYLFILAFFILNYRWQGVMMALCLGITILFCDQLSSGIIKPLFQTLRPCNDPMWEGNIRVLVNCGSGYGFVSSHAANHFGAAMFLGIIFWRKTKFVLPALLAWAALISYAQVYVGLHYPFDVAGGAGLGVLIGTGIAFLCRRHGWMD